MPSFNNFSPVSPKFKMSGLLTEHYTMIVLFIAEFYLFNPFTPKGSLIDKSNCLALDRVKSIKSPLSLKGLGEI